MQVFTLGYQGLSLELYTQTLLDANVGIVLDVREVAWSNNRKYIKSVLERTLAESEIKYSHLKSCGNPSSNRKTAKTVEECLSRYEVYLRQNPDCLAILAKNIIEASNAGRPACLTCYEKSPHDCHRKILLDVLSETTPELEIIHLQGAAQKVTTRTNQMPLFSDTINQQL